MRLAGFDLATRTGISIDAGEGVRAYSWSANAKRPLGSKSTEIVESYEAEIKEQFRDHIWAMLVSHGITAVGYEEPRKNDFERTKTTVDESSAWAGKAFKKERVRSSSNLALFRANMLATELRAVCMRLNIPALAIPESDWRKSLLGYARAPRGVEDGRKYLKQAVIKHCRLLGIEVKNDDAADSAGVLLALRAILMPAKLSRANDMFNGLEPTRGSMTVDDAKAEAERVFASLSKK